MNAKAAALPANGRTGVNVQRLAQVAIGALAAAWLAYCFWSLGIPGLGGPGGDYGAYRVIGERVLAGGPLYSAAQLAGPHVTQVGDAMYPPTTMPLILAFAAIPFEPLARTFWYAVPILAYGWAMYRIRPRGWRLIATLVLIALPVSVEAVWLGNPGIWAAAAVALGVLYRWPAAFVLLKPSLAPFALLAVRDRRGWLVGAAFAIVGVLTLPLMLDWVRVALNARGQYSGILYSLANAPLLLAPVVAGFGYGSLNAKTAPPPVNRKRGG